MAFKEKIVWEGGNTFLGNGHFNIDMAVGGSEHGSGYRAANRAPDMQLVFYMLWILYRDGDNLMFPKKSVDKFEKTPKERDYGSPEMKSNMTGVIWRFQTDLLVAGKSVYRDGRCDKGLGTIASMSKTRYTIHHLNYNYAKTIKQKYSRDDWQEYLITDPYLPEHARQEILMKSSALGAAA